MIERERGMGPVEELVSSPFFSALIYRFLTEREVSLNRILRAHSRRWKAPESAAIISNADGGLQLIEKLRAHINLAVEAEKRARNAKLQKESKSA